MKKHTSLSWAGSVSGEGGPLMIVDLPDFTQWTGVMPFAELRKLDDARAAAYANRTTTLHYWGQFTDELPAPFAADGGHLFLHFDTDAEATQKLAELRKAVEAKFPRVKVVVDEEQTTFVVPKKGSMTAELSPKSEYDAAWQGHDDEETWTHSFGPKKKKAAALFWDMEGDGVADVGVAKDGTELVLVRSWLSGEDDTEEREVGEVRALVTGREHFERTGGEITIPSGKVAVVWSPIAPFQLAGIEDPEALLLLGDDGPAELSTDDMEGVGLVVKVKPGRYAVTIGSTDDDGTEDDADDDDDDDDDDREWSGRWCRLTLIA